MTSGLTQALYIPLFREWLEKIKVEPAETRNLVLADGRTSRNLLGFCYFEIEGLSGRLPCPVIFGPKDSLFLIGATTLENFGVDVDPISKTLKPISAIIGGFTASS